MKKLILIALSILSLNTYANDLLNGMLMNQAMNSGGSSSSGVTAIAANVNPELITVEPIIRERLAGASVVFEVAFKLNNIEISKCRYNKNFNIGTNERLRRNLEAKVEQYRDQLNAAISVNRLVSIMKKSNLCSGTVISISSYTIDDQDRLIEFLESNSL